MTCYELKGGNAGETRHGPRCDEDKHIHKKEESITVPELLPRVSLENYCLKIERWMKQVIDNFPCRHGYPVGFVEYLGVGVADFELDNLVSYHLRLQNNFVKRLRSLQSKGEHPTNF